MQLHHSACSNYNVSADVFLSELENKTDKLIRLDVAKSSKESFSHAAKIVQGCEIPLNKVCRVCFSTFDRYATQASFQLI